MYFFYRHPLAIPGEAFATLDSENIGEVCATHLV